MNSHIAPTAAGKDATACTTPHWLHNAGSMGRACWRSMDTRKARRGSGWGSCSRSWWSIGCWGGWSRICGRRRPTGAGGHGSQAPKLNSWFEEYVLAGWIGDSIFLFQSRVFLAFGFFLIWLPVSRFRFPLTWRSGVCDCQIEQIPFYYYK